MMMIKTLLRILKRRRIKDFKPSKKNDDQAGSSKKGKVPSKSSKSDKTMNAEESVQDAVMDVEESIEDDDMDAEDPTKADNVPKQDNSKWFKQDVIKRPETPHPKWYKEPNSNDAPKQS
ncbi:hypothetical protein Tco_0235835 [Tanacetum coccineum]